MNRSARRGLVARIRHGVASEKDVEAFKEGDARWGNTWRGGDHKEEIAAMQSMPLLTQRERNEAKRLRRELRA